MKTYAGIGSRDTPNHELKLMKNIAQRLSSLGYILYSGGAAGADSAFETGADPHMQIFLPWDGFNGKYSDGVKYCVPNQNMSLVEKYHPKPNSLSVKGKKFMSRNSYQVLGPTLNKPVDFVICWTPEGKIRGGTGQALRIAKDYKIPVFNLALTSDVDSLSRYMQFKLLLGGWH